MQLPYHNTQVKHWNPGATLPLTLPVHLVCNTPDEEIYANIRANSRLDRKWVKYQKEHDGVAVLCGSGPSLADTLDEIRALRDAGAKVYAMNGAAKFLAERGILADYQCMIDAREQTADLIGPAKAHLFASQCHPRCFDLCDDAQVWHLQVEGIDALLPDDGRGYALIGGAASVGNTATCLAYAMGYRTLHLFGYDSCHRDGAGHAFHQKMNDGDPCAYVDFGGKTYLASLTMKLQAERFQETARALQASGCTINVHGSGLLPDMWRAPREELTEQEKYERVWQFGEYREVSPGELCVPRFLEVVQPFGKILDIGCGTGRASIALSEAGHSVTLLDFAGNCRDHEATALSFVQHDVSDPFPIGADFGICCDMMEHIPTHQVSQVLRNIMDACKHGCFFQISTVPDELGSLIDHPLHLTVRPPWWWAERFDALGHDIKWQEHGDIASHFYVTKGQQ